jgi:hypothetical protein
MDKVWNEPLGVIDISQRTRPRFAALQKAGKSFEVQVGPDAGHGMGDPERGMEFLIESLVLR